MKSYDLKCNGKPKFKGSCKLAFGFPTYQLILAAKLAFFFFLGGGGGGGAMQPYQLLS